MLEVQEREDQIEVKTVLYDLPLLSLDQIKVKTKPLICQVTSTKPLSVIVEEEEVDKDEHYVVENENVKPEVEVEL